MRKFFLVFGIAFFTISNNAVATDTEEEILIEDDEEDVDDSDTFIETDNTYTPPQVTAEVSGNIEGYYRYFPKEGLYSGQKQEYFSSIFNPEIYIEWDKGNQLIQFKGFARLSQHDNQQTHSDIRELYYQRVFNKWELSLGVKKIYWGFTESNHLVNIVNQNDVLEGSDIENKLGQPMIHFSSERKWGTIDAMIMTYFRKLQFPGTNGRLRPPFQLDNSNPTFESNAEEFNPDIAVRWSHSFKIFDVALSHFYGTSRLPLFTTSNGLIFSPSYELINQTGAELQATTGSMLWKLESIFRQSQRQTITAFTVGGEYTFSNVYKADVGILLEYNFDERDDELLNALNNDVFLGMRIALNDRQSTDFLGGANIDTEKGTITYFAEANRRIGDSWKIRFETFGFSNVDPTEFLYLIRDDSYVQLSLIKYL